MATSRLREAVQNVRKLVLLRDGAGLTDGQLLERYLADREEAAIAALVRRHGPMVWGVCRRILPNHHDAEDAFQVAFLVLVRKAASIQPREMLANWLYGVAYQTARKAQATLARRGQRERQVVDMPEPAVREAKLWRDLQPLLDQELSRLPDRYRAAILLCDVEGLTRKEAARRLGLADGVLSGQLTRGRVLLGKRLARHGIAVSGGVLATVLGTHAAAAAAPSALVAATIQWASLLATGHAAVSSTVAGLLKGVLNAMLLTKLRITAALLMGIVLAFGLGVPNAISLAHPGDTPPAAKPVLVAVRGVQPAGRGPGWREVYALKHDHPVRLVACSATWLAAVDEGGNLFLSEMETGKNHKRMVKGGKNEGETASIDLLHFTPAGNELFGIIDGRRGIFHMNLQKPEQPKTVGFKGKVPRHRGFSFDGETWLESYDEGRVLHLQGNLWTANNVKKERITFKSEITSTLLSSNDKWLAVVTADGNVHLHDRDTLKETQTLAMKKESVMSVQFSQDGKQLAVVGREGVAKVYDTTTGKVIANLKGHRGTVYAVSFGADGKTLATGGEDRTARIWDAATGKQLGVIKGHRDAVRSLAFHPGGNVLVTGSADKTVKAWKVRESR